MIPLAEVLSVMDPIDLAEMDSVALMNRWDTKYVMARSSLPAFLRHVQADYRVLDVSGIRLSAYSTLYFDTPDHTCFLQHHNGKLNRHKFRTRTYHSTNLSFFEVKAKNNKGRTNKRRLQVDAIEPYPSPASREFIRATTGGLPELVPQLWTYFSRVTLVHRQLPERVTIDLDLAFHHGESYEAVPDIVIAEVKQLRDNRHSPLREQLRRQRIRPMRVSKYCLGSVLLKPGLKRNRFKPYLRALYKVASES